jgi:hypothetical protein
MSPNIPTLDEGYRRYADLLLEHHRLLSEGKDDEAEIEAIEEEMTRLWERLDVPQQRSLSGLGSDLNWVRRKFASAPRGRRPEDVTPEEFQELAHAREVADWHGLLHYLRLCAPAMSPSELASLRAVAWDHIGLPQLVSVFDDVAAKT